MIRRSLVLGVCLAAAASLAALSFAQAAEDNGREAALKAAFLYNFAKFTEWPRQRSDAEAGPLIFCVGQNSTLRPAIDELQGKKVGDRDVRPLMLAESANAAMCHVLFVDSSLPPRLRRQAETDLFGVLTVSDLPDFARAGGDIGFFFANNQLRFQINLEAARRRGLGFSSKLLRLADVIGQQSALPSRFAAAARALTGRL